MSYISGHAGKGSALHFPSAAADDLQGQRVEPTHCVRCTRMFFRAAVAVQKDAPRPVCPQCIRAIAMRAAKELSEAEAARKNAVRCEA